MSETAPQSLGSIIDQNTAGGTSTAGVAPTARPSLQATIDQVTSAAPAQSAQSAQVAPAQVSQTSPVAAQAAAPPPQNSQGSASPVQSAPQPQQSPAVLRALLAQRNFAIPEDLQSDDQIADVIAQQLDAAEALTQSEEYRLFVAQQDAFKRFLQTQTQATSQVQQAAPQVAATSAAPQATSAAPTIPQDKLLSAITSGFVVQGQDGKFTARHVTFQAHADQLNLQNQQAMEKKAAFAADPDAYIRQAVADATSQGAANPNSQVAAEIQTLLNELRAERAAAQTAQVDAWVNQNHARLYDAQGKLTPYGNLYQQFEEVISTSNPNISPLERHNKVLEKLTAAENAFRATQPAQAQAPAAQQTQPATQSFLQRAGTRNPIPTNRMSDFGGPAKNQVQPLPPTGKAGLPSLRGVVEQQLAVNGVAVGN